MRNFTTIERGTVNDMPYYVARRHSDGWTRCWIKRGDRNIRRSMNWLRKQKKLNTVTTHWKKQ